MIKLSIKKQLTLCSRLIILVFTVFLTACGQASKKQSEAILLQSKNYAFIDQLLSTDKTFENQQTIDAWLTVPKQGPNKAPHPVVILLHSSWGVSSQEWFYANEFQKIGIASIVIDSFSSRGIEKTSLDQSLVSSAAMLNDAYAALAYIQENPLLDADRVAVMGFSKGAIAALYSSLKTVQKAALDQHRSFSAHVAYYPWCGLELLDMQLSNAPILIHTGSRDIVTPVALCRDLINQRISNADQLKITILEYPDARHAFDHPVLARIPWTVHMDAQIPANCHIKETEKNLFYEMNTARPVNGENLGEVLQQCSSYHGTVKYHRKSAQHALHRTIEFLSTHLQINL